MSVKKCTSCGLVNFATMTHCKRCQQALDELAPIAAERSYQQPEMPAATHAKPTPDYSVPPPVFHPQQQFQAYEMPPPPPVFNGQQPVYQPQAAPACCVKCGNMRNVAIQSYKKDYVPPALYLTIFLGWLIMLILILILRKRHEITMPWCDECWRQFKLSKSLETVTSVGCLVLLGVGLCAGIGANNMIWFVVCLVVGFGAAIWGYLNHKQKAPNYKKVDREKVIITPFSGQDICFQK